MPAYQLRRPTPVKIFPKRFRRQLAPGASASAVPVPAEEEEDSGPESPDSPQSSPDVAGVLSDGESSDSEDEEEVAAPSAAPTQPAAVAPPTAIEGTQTTLSTSAPSVETEPATTTTTSSSRTSTTSPSSTTSPAPAFSGALTSQNNNGVAQPGVTQTDPAPTVVPPAITSTGVAQPSGTGSSGQPGSVASASTSPPTPAESDNASTTSSPQETTPRPQEPIMTKGAAIAATVLGVAGAIALLVAIFFCIKRRKRKSMAYNQPIADDAFDPGNTGSLRAPETSHIGSDQFFMIRSETPQPPINAHLTRSTERSNTLFGAGPYERPETVSTERNRVPPSPNPFADPPLEKAYDVLQGRPRSTTLTDRGSWVKNPFRDPQSERFDPFGELTAKAQRERVKQMQAQMEPAALDQARREAELAREFEAQERAFRQKEAMGLAPDGLAPRKGSGVTVEGLGVLDRSGGR